jgi:excisionase family DNA binding protein
MHPQDEATLDRKLAEALDHKIADVLTRIENAVEAAFKARTPTRALTLPQFADMLGVGLSTVYKIVKESQVKSVTIGGRRRILAEDAEAFLAGRHAAPAPMRVMPWDRDGIAKRQYHPRRGDPERVVKKEEPQRRPVGRPRKNQPAAGGAL